MDDEGIEGRAALHLENARYGGRIGGIGAEAVDRFGGEGDQVATANERRASCQRFRGRRANHKAGTRAAVPPQRGGALPC